MRTQPAPPRTTNQTGPCLGTWDATSGVRALLTRLLAVTGRLPSRLLRRREMDYGAIELVLIEVCILPGQEQAGRFIVLPGRRCRSISLYPSSMAY